LAQEIQTRHKVTLTVASISDSYKAAAELKLLPGIGQVIGFADYATAAAEAFVPEAQRSRPEVMSLYEPSRPMYDTERNVYIFRITGAEPAHRPATLDEVKEQVAFDFRRAAAMELAKADAQGLVDQARTSGLKPAAEQAGLKLHMTGAYSSLSAAPIKDYPVTSKSQRTFTEKTFALMGLIDSAATQPSTRPVGLVELPADGKVAVAELIAIESRISPESSDLIHAIFGQRLMQSYAQAIAGEWFNLDSLAQRVGFTDYAGKIRSRGSQASAQ
jgi:hypothetical protein